MTGQYIVSKSFTLNQEVGPEGKLISIPVVKFLVGEWVVVSASPRAETAMILTGNDGQSYDVGSEDMSLIYECLDGPYGFESGE